MGVVHRGHHEVRGWAAIVVAYLPACVWPLYGSSRRHPRKRSSSSPVRARRSTPEPAAASPRDARVQNLLADHQYFRVQSELDQLPPEQAQLYRGILANRNNDPKESISCWSRWSTRWRASGDAVHEKLLRKALAEDYLRDGDLSKAAKAISDAREPAARHAEPDEQDEIEMPLKLLATGGRQSAHDGRSLRPVHAPGEQESAGPHRHSGFCGCAPAYLDAGSDGAVQSDCALAGSRGRASKSLKRAATIHSLTGRPCRCTPR